MANDGQIVFEVTADGKHAIADIKELTRQIDQESKKWDKSVSDSTENMGGSFSKLLKGLSIAAIGAGIVNGLKSIASEAVQAASDLEEVQNVVDVTFGENSNKVETWAKNAGTQFGLTETQAKKFSSTMGAMLKSAGLAGNQIVDVSTDLAGLAADMASFYNLNFEESFAKIRSGISGQTMPLKELGIDMSVATLNAFALEKGLSKTFDQMSQGEQVMLRYQYLMKATADAQGDFQRTSDGYANAMRKMETNVESLKAKLGQTFLPIVADAVSALNGFLDRLTGDAGRTVLDDFADIDFKTEAKLAEIEQIKNNAQETAAILEQLYAKDDNGETGKNAADYVAQFGVRSQETAEHLAALGFSEEEIAANGEKWLEVCRRLVKTIPGLNEIINTETGEVTGGRKAIDEYINAWSDGQKKLALLKAEEQRKEALQQKFSELPGLEVDVLLAKNRLEKAQKQLQGYADQFKVDLDWYDGDLTLFDEGAIRKFGLTNEQYQLLQDEINYFLALKKNAEDAEKAFNEQNDAYNEALSISAERTKAIEDEYGAIETADDKTKEWSADLQEAGKAAVEASETALTALADYAEGVRESVEKAVNSFASGFSKIETPMDKNRQKVKDLEKSLTELDSTSKDYEKDLKKINDQIAATRGDQISAQSMNKALEQQAEYMDKYLSNLQKAREIGVSDSVLAALSDGTEESFDYLAELAEAAPDEVKKINENFDKVAQKKKELTDALTGQKLSVDQVYQDLQAKAKEAVAALDLGDEAAQNSGRTIAGLAQGINDHVGEVQTAVDNILAQLDRLNGYGININFDGFGSINFTTATVTPEGSGRFGLVAPHDNFIARMHEGEQILTRQETAIWNALRGGGISGVDLDALGGVVRENVKPGGDVYLDGRIVGRVMSDVQGSAYKSLQRSGWQK